MYNVHDTVYQLFILNINLLIPESSGSVEFYVYLDDRVVV